MKKKMTVCQPEDPVPNSIPLRVVGYNLRNFLSITGSEIADDLFKVLLNTTMFIGGFIAFVLDNTMPGKSNWTGHDAQ